jgi:hypothetical protein
MRIDDISGYLIEKPIKNRLKGKNQGEIHTYASDALYPVKLLCPAQVIKGMPEPDLSGKALVSDCNKIVLFWGNDYKEPESLGAEIEFMLDRAPLRFSVRAPYLYPRG